METKQKIVAASADLFNLKGYDGCSLQDIMMATGLKKGGIYNYFKSKDDIAAAAFDYNLDRVIAKFRERLDCDNTSTEKIFSVIDVMSGLADGTTMKGGCPVFNTAVISSNHEFLKAKAREGLDLLKEYIKIKIEEGKESCEFVEGADSEKISAMIIMTLEGGVMMSRIYDDINHINVARDYLKHYLNKFLLIKPHNK